MGERVLLLRVPAGIVLAFSVVAPGIAQAQGAPGVPANERQAGRGLEATHDVPIEVRDVVVTSAGVSATLMNRSAGIIGAYSVGLARSLEPDPTHFEAMQESHGLSWQPGSEHSVLLVSRPSDEPARVFVRAVVYRDGTGYGDPRFIQRIRSDWERQRTGLAGALGLLTGIQTPASEEELQDLIDRIALEMARVPIGRSGEQQLQPYVQVIAGLKRLQGRELAATERLSREMAQLAATLRRELEAVPGTATAPAR